MLTGKSEADDEAEQKHWKMEILDHIRDQRNENGAA
jgi:hypothetical protein